ncbi:transposable element Tcb2 transposase [Trichonephila clavipes]|nr:transposable element Tcb2 transposase [Trichonephila clavipes]
MIRAGLMLDSCTPPNVFERGSASGVRYRDEILKPYVCILRGACDSEFISMEDNAKPLRALLVDEFLESEDIHRLDLSSRSPDFNPIEHIWDDLGRVFETRNPPREPYRK